MSKLTDPPEHCTPSIGLGALTGQVEIAEPKPPAHQCTSEARKRFLATMAKKVERDLSIQVAVNLMHGHMQLIGAVLGLNHDDIRAALVVVMAEHDLRKTPEPAPPG